MRTEQQALRLSLGAILTFALLGIVFGLVTGSGAIIFDGVVSLVDAVMSVVSIVVAGLIARAAVSPRFTMGFWHFEPMVLAVNALLLISVAAYAVVQSFSTILEGGRDVEFGPALVYAAIVLTLTVTVGLVEHRANRRIGSALVAMDVKGWLVAGAVTAALLVAFVIGILLDGTTLASLRPYVDPAVLMVVALVLLPVPVPTLRRALAEIALVAPADLRDDVERVARDVEEAEGFAGHRASVAQVGRARQVDIVFHVPAGLPPRPLEDWDRIREAVEQRVRRPGPDDWVTVSFTTRWE